MSKSMMFKTIVGLAIIAVLVPIVYFGGVYLRILCLFVGGLSAYEINNLFHEKVNWIEVFFTVIAIFTFYYCLPSTVLGCIVAWLVLLFILQFILQEDANFVSYTFLISILVGLAVRSLDMLYVPGSFEGFKTTLFIALACYACDTGAYFFGSFFGKHKMAPKVSPNKTWEGAIGGYFCGVILSFIFSRIFTLPYNQDVILLSVFILPFIGQMGDLSFSSIKRQFNVKDFGGLLPYHGGVLDRIDSMLFCLLFFQIILVFWRVL